MERILTGLRPYVASDLERLARLIAEADAHPPVEPSTPEALLARWTHWHVDPERDLTVLPGSAGELVAYSRASLVTNPTVRVSMDIAVHPNRRRQGTGSALYHLVEERARDLGAPHITSPIFLALGQTRPEQTGFLERRGFFADRSYWQMRIDDIQAQPAPHWPSGFTYRQFREAAQDAERWASLIRQEFEEPATAARVEAQISEPGSGPDGYIFAVDEQTGKEVGTCRARIDAAAGERVGYVGTVGVLREYRLRGLATSLVLQMLHYLARQRMESAILYVENGNLNARRLYEKMGWRYTYCTVHYWKSLAPRGLRRPYES